MSKSLLFIFKKLSSILLLIFPRYSKKTREDTAKSIFLFKQSSNNLKGVVMKRLLLFLMLAGLVLALAAPVHAGMDFALNGSFEDNTDADDSF